jgi:protein O-GlcNAc transferase
VPSYLILALFLAQQTTPVDRLVHEAQQALQLGRYSEAREKFRKALEHTPRNPALWSYLGMADAQLNDLDAAIGNFQKALSFAPNDAQTHFNLGLLFRQKGDSQKAQEMYRRGLKLAPDDPAANQNYALLLMETQKFREAIPLLQKLKALGTSDVSVRVALIESYLKGGMKDEGEREIQSYLHSPNSTPAEQLKLAKVLIEDKQAEAAQIVLEHIVKVSPDAADAHAQLGLLLANKDQYEEATREMGRAVQLSPDSAEYSMRLAEILILWKRYPTALEFLTAVKDRFGELAEYQYKLGVAYYGLRRIPQAITIFENLAREHPELDLAQSFLGNCYQTTGAFEKAERHYKKAIEVNPQKSSYYAALAQLEKALLLDPQDLQSKLELAFCYEKKMNYPRAQSLLEEVVQQQRDLVPAHVALARVYYRQRKKEEGDREKSIIARLEAEQQARKSQTEKPPDFPTP